MDESVDTQYAILLSAATLLRQRTFEDITYLDLADASGVSERTIYRRFPTRSHLLEALALWLEAEHFPLSSFATPAEFRASVHERFRAFDAEPAYAFVAARGESDSPHYWARLRTGFDMSADEISDAFDTAVRDIVPKAPQASWTS